MGGHHDGQMMRLSETERSERSARTRANTEANAARQASAPQLQPRGDAQRRKHQGGGQADAPSLAEQDEIAQRARALWAADRVAGRLARAVALVRDGKPPNDPELLLAALDKYKHIVTDVDAKVAEKRSLRTAQQQSRTGKIEAQRVAEEEKVQRCQASRMAAEAARTRAKSEREGRRTSRADGILEAKRQAEIDRRARQMRELVDAEWDKEQQHVKLANAREMQRRQDARAVQEREHRELVQAEEQRRGRCLAALEREQVQREESDPQVIKALPGHPGLLGGHSKNIAPYAQQQRPLRFQLRRWQHPD
jgi:IgA-specific serine endopeptidase